MQNIYLSYQKIHESSEVTTSTPYNNGNQPLMEVSSSNFMWKGEKMNEEHMDTSQLPPYQHHNTKLQLIQ